MQKEKKNISLASPSQSIKQAMGRGINKNRMGKKSFRDVSHSIYIPGEKNGVYGAIFRTRHSLFMCILYLCKLMHPGLYNVKRNRCNISGGRGRNISIDST